MSVWARARARYCLQIKIYRLSENEAGKQEYIERSNCIVNSFCVLYK